jgi:hypothetical protein
MFAAINKNKKILLDASKEVEKYETIVAVWEIWTEPYIQECAQEIDS